MKKVILISLAILATGCATVPSEDCSSYDVASYAYMDCMAATGSKEFQFRLGMDYLVKNQFAQAVSWLEDAAADDTTVNSIPVDVFGTGFSDGFSRRTRTVNQEGKEEAAFMLAKIYGEELGGLRDPDKVEDYKAKAGAITVSYQESGDGFLVQVFNTDAKRLVQGGQEHFTSEIYSFRIGMPRGE